MDIINVVAYSKDGEEEEELKQVRQLMQRQMEPLSSSSSYTQFNKLLNFGIPGWNQDLESKEVVDTFSTTGSSEYLNDILEHLQSHMNKCSMDISSQQNKLLLRCKSLDDTATMVTKKMTVSLNHAMVTAEKVCQVGMLNKQSNSVKANFGTVMHGLNDIESLMKEQNILDGNSTTTPSRWPLLQKLKNETASGDSDDRIYTQPVTSPEAITDTHFAYHSPKLDNSSTMTNKPSMSSMPLSKASLLPPSSQSRPTIVRTKTSHSSLAATHLKELAAVADKQEERIKLSKHSSK
ncbi:unnamed protein product [Umbelopsis vinacea]